ncbi:MAG: GatB/YqeY domain-containing protein [bacterium]|nr:GatB/YqeY domain-containing protein [bacterium]
MSLTETINTQIPDAMRAKDAERLSALRNLKTALVTEAIALKKKGDLTDDEAFVVIKRLVKQRKESAEQFLKGGRKELAKAEEAESKILEAFLPAQMSEKEVRKIAEATKKKLGIADKSKLGQLIGAVVKETKGKADGVMIKKIVEELLS